MRVIAYRGCPEVAWAIGPADHKLLAEAFPSGWFRQFVRPRKPARLAGGAQRLLGEFEVGQVEDLRRRDDDA